MIITSDAVDICTFPNDDANYCHEFTIERVYLLEWLKSQTGEKRTMDEYLDTYSWDETYFLYLQAKALGKIIEEREVA